MGTKRFTWTEEKETYLRENILLATYKEIADAIGCKIEQVRYKARLMGIEFTEAESRSTIMNRIKRAEKKTTIDLNASPVEEKVNYHYLNRTPTVWVKLTNNLWTPKSHYVLRKAGVELPKKFYVGYKDDNPLNCELDNLEVLNLWQKILREREKGHYLPSAKPKSRYGKTKLQQMEQERAKKRAEMLARRMAKQVERDAKRQALAEKKAAIEAKKKAKAERVATNKQRLQDRRDAKEQRKALRAQKEEANKQRREEEKRRKAEAKKLEREQKRAVAISSRQPYKHLKTAEKVYKTKVVDYSQLIRVEVAKGTVMYVKPGTDIEKLKAKYQTPLQRFKQAS